MVRGWLGAGILALFLILSLVTGELMDNAHAPTGELLDSAAEKALDGEFDTAVALGLAAKERWDRQWNGTATVADHSPMDDMDALFGEMEIYARTGEEPHFAACCRELARRVNAMADAHQFSWRNVL